MEPTRAPHADCWIELTQGYRACVDAGDYEWLAQWKWYALVDRNHLVYAARNMWVGGRRRKVSMHQILLGTVGQGHSVHVDHINGDGLDNRRSNLRVTDAKGNQENRRGPNRNSRSGVRGVWWDRRACNWRIQVGHNGRLISGGRFESLAEAIRAVEELRRAHYSEEVAT